MIDQALKKIKALYKLSGMEDKFEQDLKEGVIAKIKSDDKRITYSKYAQAYTSSFKVNSCSYQYYVFKPGYSYKNGKLYFKDKNRSVEVKNENFDKNLDE
jgi:hypothetical protein